MNADTDRQSTAPNLRQQIIISGVGGQGVLFVTRLLAGAAIRGGYPVYTSETHGMAQRGGTVISHLKVGAYESPLIRPDQADGLIALKSDNLDQHGAYVKPGGWAVVNGASTAASGLAVAQVEADRLAQRLSNAKAVNLIMLGFALSRPSGPRLPFCTLADIKALLMMQLERSPAWLQSALDALKAGASA